MGRLEKALVWYSLAIVAVTALAWGNAWYRYGVLGMPAEESTLTAHPSIHFTDLTGILPGARHPFGHGAEIEAGPPVFNLAAPAIVPYWLLSLLGGFAVPVYLTALAGLAVWCCVAVYGGLGGVSGRTRVLFGAASVVTSYPLLFEMDRANIEGVIWGLVLAGAVWAARGRSVVAAVCIALAGSIKPFPLVLLVLFLYRGWFRQVGVAVGVWVAVNLGAFAAFGPSLASCWQGYVAGVNDYKEERLTGYPGYDMDFDHSLFGLVRQVGRLVVGWDAPDAGDRASSGLYLPYLVSAAVVVAGILWFGRKLPVLNQIFVCFLLMVTVPPANYDYTLIQLYVPLGLFLFHVDQEGERWWLVAVILVSFGVLFTPQTFLREATTGFGGQVKAVFLASLLAVSLFVPMKNIRLKV